MGRIALAAVLVLAGCGGSARLERNGSDGRAGPCCTTWTDHAAHLSAQIPRGWHVTARRLTAVTSPVQRLVATSYPLRQRRPDGGCRPATALHQLPPGGAMVYVFEYEGPTRHDVEGEPPRPRHFALERRALGDYECMGRSYLLRFGDHGRALQAHVYLGPRTTDATRRQALDLLDSLRVGAPNPRDAAVWRAPRRLLSRGPYLGVACPQPNRFACDRVGLAVWLRAPALAVDATIDGRPLRLDDPGWSAATARGGRRRMFAGFLQPAGLRHGPLKLHADDGPGRWIGRRPVHAGVGLMIERRPGVFVRTSLVVPLAAGWG